MAGWKIPELNGGFWLGKLLLWSIFQHAMFDYWRVLQVIFELKANEPHKTNFLQPNNPEALTLLTAPSRIVRELSELWEGSFSYGWQLHWHQSH